MLSLDRYEDRLAGSTGSLTHRLLNLSRYFEELLHLVSLFHLSSGQHCDQTQQQTPGTSLGKEMDQIRQKKIINSLKIYTT